MKITLTKEEVKIIKEIFDSFAGQGGIVEYSEQKCYDLSQKLCKELNK